jgi:hypothetical protein
MYPTLAILGGFALLYSLFATRIEKTGITGPIVLTANPWARGFGQRSPSQGGGYTAGC